MQMLRAPAAQQGMLLLDPSLSDFPKAERNQNELKHAINNKIQLSSYIGATSENELVKTQTKLPR
jgi:hypothetical protein